MNMNPKKMENGGPAFAQRPDFTGEADLPYGFITGTLARLRAEKRQQESSDRIGWRALLASLAAVAIAVTVTLSVNFKDRGGDLERESESVRWKISRSREKISHGHASHS